MSYQNGLNYLASKTRVVELCNLFGARLTVCPDWNGRVMTSTCDGLNGNSFGFINVQDIDALDETQVICSYGGEDDVMLSLSHASLVPFRVEALLNDQEIQMRRSIGLVTPDGTPCPFDMARTVRLLDEEDVRDVFGFEVAASVVREDVSYVAFKTENSVTGCEYPMVSSIRSMFNSSSSKVVVVPLCPEQSNDAEPPFDVNYYGSSPHGRLRQLPGAVLLRADGKGRCQITVIQNHALPLIGSIDFREGMLTLIAYDMPYQPDWFEGDMRDAQRVVQVYNHGPTPGESFSSGYYLIETIVPHQDIDEELVHNQATIHISADNETLTYLVDHLFGIDYDEIYRRIMR